jgi:hypothetical protein
MAVSMHLEARSGFRRSSSDFAVTSNCLELSGAVLENSKKGLL